MLTRNMLGTACFGLAAVFFLGGCGDDAGWEPVEGKDLRAAGLEVPTLYRAETHTITFTVQNNGSETITSPFEAQLEIFEDGSYSQPFCAPLTATYTSEIISGGYVDIVFSLPLDAVGAEGIQLYMVATVDSLGEINEAIEDNNVSEETGMVEPDRKADLVVQDVVVPDYMLQGRDYPITVTVANVDNKIATAPFYVEATEPAAGWSYRWQVSDDLPPGESVELTTTYSVSALAALGPCTFTATADPTGVVEERDETNNALTADTEVAIMDLAIELTDYPPSYVVGTPFNISARVTNLGTATSPASAVSIYVAPEVYASPIMDWPPQSVPSLAPTEFYDFTRTLTIEWAVPGNLFVFFVDPDDHIDENDESNNFDGLTLVD